MIVDSSALIEILRGQPQAERCLDVLRREATLVMSVGNYLEACLVADNLTDRTAPQLLSTLMDLAGITLVPVTAEQAEIARRAHQRYGKGIDSRARLNFGDCFAYALASERNEPLLYVGNDFTHTDIRSALH